MSDKKSLERNILRRFNIGDVPKRSAAKYPDLTSLVFMGNKVTFSELNDNCSRMAQVFEGLGAKKGDRISFMTHNWVAYICSWLGACKIGCVVNPLNFMLKPNEIEYIVGDAGSRFFFLEDMLVPQALEAAPNLKSVEKFGIIRINAPDTETPQGWLVLEELFAAESDASEPLVETDDDTCSLMYTSGTPHTGVEIKIFDDEDNEVPVGGRRRRSSPSPSRTSPAIRCPRGSSSWPWRTCRCCPAARS